MSESAQPARYFAAVDLGASSGRVVAARVDDGGIRAAEVHRFGNGPVLLDGVLCWAVERLFEETVRGLTIVAETAQAEGAVFAGIGVDSWGVDYGLLDLNGNLLTGVKHHRGADPNGPADAEQAISAVNAYRMSGIPPQAINTSYQLRSDVRAGAVRGGEQVLLIPDLWVHFLTGVAGAERTIASTTQLIDPRTGDWSPQLIEAFGLGNFAFPPTADSGTFAGYTTSEITARIGASRPVPVYRVAGHDTASALAFAVPDGAELLISSGSWSLAGVCLSEPLLSEDARVAGYTNEAGIGGSTLLLRNLAGMWLLTECTRVWAERGEAEPDVVRLVRQASSEPADPAPIFDVSDPRLLEPGDMPARIAALCRESGQYPPPDVLGTVRSIIESLAAAYAETARVCERLTGVPLTSVRIVGGGSRNDLLCRRTAELTGLPVTVGPAEASALGNLAVQLVAAGEMTSTSAVYDRFELEDVAVRMPRGRYPAAVALSKDGRS
ncbi:rhamnulokinase [Mycetocola miduiensis]|uniref:Rhamnulokinase n=1 Tax=Mycetocola miduiensis TaxID=995034 RepID=A0A1I4YDV1_9MICO|nr:FGGY-family carbohydrate kinase [Mycetocola miduiensis]SFN36204.1 rhamnulokinase [Mycetocola miduiensis]